MVGMGVNNNFQNDKPILNKPIEYQEYRDNKPIELQNRHYMGKKPKQRIRPPPPPAEDNIWGEGKKHKQRGKGISILAPNSSSYGGIKF